MRDLPVLAEESSCSCDPSFDQDRLVVDADECEGRGVLATEPSCRATVVDSLADRDADAVVTVYRGLEREYRDDAATLLLAAGRFVERLCHLDDALASRAVSDPLRAARDARARAGPVGTLAAETGLSRFADAAYADVLVPRVGSTIARARVARHPPSGATLVERRTTGTGATVRTYRRDGRQLHWLAPVEVSMAPADREALVAAHETLASGAAGDCPRAPWRAVERTAVDPATTASVANALRRHTRGYGVVEDLLSDPHVSDVYAVAPLDERPLRVVVDGASRQTNVYLGADGGEAVASRLRAETGTSFSRATPTVDAAVEAVPGRTVRVAGVRPPASDGVAFAFRDGGEETWTLPALVANGTVTAEAAAFLSLAVERGAATLVAGPRGAGKTTLLGALLWELPAWTRTLVVEDTPELPVDALQTAHRGVQRLRATTDDSAGVSPKDALRAALRLGESALVVGEVRGEEAAVLYEAMRVGANASAVLGTVHGDGGAGVRERVVSDLGVPESSFAVTDLVVTTGVVGGRRRVVAVEEVRGEATTSFESLFALEGSDLRSGGCVDAGRSVAVEHLCAPDERYADVLAALEERRGALESLVADGRTGPTEIVRSYASGREDASRRGDPC